MHLKNNILFLCVTFYFFQCQGAPSLDQISMVKRMVPQLVGEDDITLDNVRTVFSQVASAFDITFEPSILDELEKIEYSKDEAITNTLAFIASNDRNAMNMVNELLARHLVQNDGIDISQLRDVLDELEQRADASILPFPRTILEYIVKDLRKTAYNRLYTLYEVRTYTLAFLASGHEYLMILVQDLVENVLIRDSDSVSYEQYITVIEGVNERIELQKPIPSYGLFEAEILSRKLTVNAIENMIFEKLFP